MDEIILASFHDPEKADHAIDQLKEGGFNEEEISLITHYHGKEGTFNRTLKGAGQGAATGTIVGGLAGFLAGAIGVIIIGPIAALLGLGGVIGTTITGLVFGAAAGGLVGALVKLGVPEEKAKKYEETIKAGGVLLAITDSEKLGQAEKILENSGADDVVRVAINR